MHLSEVSTKQIKGIGDKTAAVLKKLSIESVEDLLWYAPRSYLKYPEITKINTLKEGDTVAVKGVVDPNFYEKKGGKMVVSTFSVHDDTGTLRMVFFRQSYLRSIFYPGKNFVFYGTVRTNNGKFELQMPEYYKPEDYGAKLKSLQPVYALTKGITSKAIQKYVQAVIDEIFPVSDTLDPDFIRSNDFLSLSDAYRYLHLPVDTDLLQKARRRLAFEEFLRFLTKIEESREENTSLSSDFIIRDYELCDRYAKSLPFELTNAQKNTFEEIKEDISSGFAMRRLIQGDVGSGKTMVAFLSMVAVCNAGYQSAMMAPTEVLATQHYEKLIKDNETYHLNLKPVLLTGSVTGAKKREILKGIEDGTYNAVIGTHAIFQEKVVFQNLALVITDEQHRFGVKQRDALSEKGRIPHVLVLSATPIPRTLSLTLYADLKVSVMDELPAKRIPIKSCIIGPNMRTTAYKFLGEEITKGHQAYIICPMVEENEDVSLENVTDYPKKLEAYFHGSLKYAVLHGRMKAADKERIMTDFARKEFDCLISTTVIEVGIDVPNSTLIIIENAERFGLATLHQLRGRVGRGDAQSFCVFIDGTGKGEQNERLKVLKNSTDGFFIAKEDLRLRGPGDLTGIRQSGDMNFKIGDIINDYDVLMLAKEYFENHG